MKMIRNAVSIAFLAMYDDFDELESILSINNIAINGQDESPV